MDLRFTIQLKKNESEEVSTAWKRFSCFVFTTSQFIIDWRRVSPSFELLARWLNMFASSIIKMGGLLVPLQRVHFGRETLIFSSNFVTSLGVTFLVSRSLYP